LSAVCHWGAYPLSPLPETLVHDLTVPVGGPFEDDLVQIQTLDALEDAVPAYILARSAPSDWILVCYVPDSATVRDKVSIVWAGPPNYVSLQPCRCFTLLLVALSLKP
jgi:hypothetical protein